MNGGRQPQRFTLQGAVTKAASYSLAPADYQLGRFEELVFTLEVTAAEADDLDETYDLYVITQNEAGATWDLIHFPQIATTGAKTYVARIRRDLLPEQVTTASPGVASVESGTLAVAAGQLNAAKSLLAGRVRHGPWGDKLGYELVITGTVTSGISFSIEVEAR